MLREDLRAVRGATLDVVMAANALEEALLLAMESGLEPGADDTALAAIGLELKGLLDALRALGALANGWADRVILTEGPNG